MKKHLDIHDALQSSIRAYKLCLAELQRQIAPPPGSSSAITPQPCMIEQLKTETFESLSTTLYHLGLASIDWISPRPDLGMLQGFIQPAFSAASQYRQMNIDGIIIKPSDAPFVSGLAQRLSIEPKEIYQANRIQISALEQAFWALTGKTTEPQITP